MALGWPTYESHMNGSVALADRSGRGTGAMTSSGSSSVFAGFRFPWEVIAMAVRWYLRYGCRTGMLRSCWPSAISPSITSPCTGGSQRFTPEFIEAARLCRHAPDDRWFVDET